MVFPDHITLHITLCLARHLAAILLNQLSHICPDRFPEYWFKMGITKSEPVNAFIEVHKSIKGCHTGMGLQKGTLAN